MAVKEVPAWQLRDGTDPPGERLNIDLAQELEEMKRSSTPAATTNTNPPKERKRDRKKHAKREQLNRLLLSKGRSPVYEEVNGRYKKTSRRMKKLRNVPKARTPSNKKQIVKQNAEEHQVSSEVATDHYSNSIEDREFL